MTSRRSQAGRMRRRLLAVLPLMAVLTVFGPAGPAAAHAYLTVTNPADGADLTAAPGTLRLGFSESVELEATRIEVTGEDGVRIPVRSLHIVKGESTEEPSAVTGRLPRLARGAYRVSWETLSSDDLHRTSGTFTFGVGRAVHATAFREPAPRVEEVGLRWLLFGGLSLALGGLLAGRLYRRSGTALAARRCRPAAVAGATVGLLASAALLADQVASSGLPLDRVLRNGYGTHWAIRAGGFVLLAAAAMLAGGRRRRYAAVATGLGAASVGVGSALLGHSSAGSGGPTRIAADASHLLAAATWAGTLLILGAALVRERGRTGERRPSTAALRAFRVPAAAAVSVMVVTGCYLASHVVGSVDAALLTTYGRALLLKLGLFAVIAVLGLVNTRRLHRPDRPGGPRRTVIAEAAVAVVVLGLAAILTSGQPAREPQFVAVSAPRTAPFAQETVADLQETLRVGPNRPGSNIVLVEVFQTRRPAPGPVTQVLVRAVDNAGRTTPRRPASQASGAGPWSAPLQLAASGPTRIEVSVVRPGLPLETYLFDWVVGQPQQPVRAVSVSNRPIGGPLRELATWLAGLAVLGWAVVALRRRSRHPAPTRTSVDGERPVELAGVR